MPEPSTDLVCGEFADPANPNLGRCSPYRQKTDCEAPVRPDGPCSDNEYTTEYDPDLTPPFRVLSKLYDTTCELILDTTGAVITGEAD